MPVYCETAGPTGLTGGVALVNGTGVPGAAPGAFIASVNGTAAPSATGAFTTSERRRHALWATIILLASTLAFSQRSGLFQSRRLSKSMALATKTTSSGVGSAFL